MKGRKGSSGLDKVSAAGVADQATARSAVGQRRRCEIGFLARLRVIDVRNARAGYRHIDWSFTLSSDPAVCPIPTSLRCREQSP